MTDKYEEAVHRLAITVAGGALLGIVFAAFFIVKYAGKYLWHFLSFTGLWTFVAIFVVYVITRSADYLVWPTFFSLLFVPVWTGRNLLRLSGHLRPNKPLNGVFFGVETRSWKPAGKPITRDGHILVIGGAGTGKSSCIAIPTLRYFWNGTFLAVDIKGELAEKSGRKAHVFNPSSPQTPGYDPFYLARKQENPVAQIRDIALTLAIYRFHERGC